MLEFASTVIPASQLSSTPIYLLATAGMRLLPAVQRDEILSAACLHLQTATELLLPDCSQNVRVITGEEEGLFGWIAVNYLMDGFDKHEHHSTGSEPHASTYGFLDMGGASTQIAFEPSEGERLKHADNLLEVRMVLLSGKEVRHPVFVTTWLGFGTNQARDRYVDQQIKAQLRVSDSAHQHTDLDAPTIVPNAERPVILVDDPCLPKSLLLSEPRHSGYTLRGTGDFAACVRKTAPLLNKEVQCLDFPCLFNGVHVPAIDFSVNHFIGISEYWYSTQDVWSMGQVYDYVGFEKEALAYCGKEWSSILKEHTTGQKWKGSVELSRLEAQCFKAAWIVNVLHEGIGIPRIIDSGGEGDGKDMAEKGTQKAIEKGLLAPARQRPPSFQSMNQVGGLAISWTLGKMVLEVSKGATAGLPPPSNSSSATSISDSVSDWTEHLPTWPSTRLRTTLSTAPSFQTLAVLTLSILVIALAYLYGLSPTAPRRRNSFVARFTGTRVNRRNSNMPSSSGSLSLEDSIEDGLRSPLLKTALRNSAAASSLAGTVLSSLQYGVYRLSSTLRGWSQPTGSLGLPMSTASYESGIPLISPAPFRPRNIRHANSSPGFLRSTSAMVNASHGNPSGAAHYLDAPDVSDRERGAPLSRSSTYTVSPSKPFSSSVAPPPMSSNYRPAVSSSSSASTSSDAAIGMSTSRPVTPVWSNSTLTLSKLSARSSTESSPERKESTLPVMSSSYNLDDIASAEGEGVASNANSALGGAKLRSSRSLNGSQVNLTLSKW